MDGKEKSFYLPRLPRQYYQGDAVVHWSLPVFNRATGWLSEKFEFQFRELMLHTQAREGLLCPIYCLMPDHIHLFVRGSGNFTLSSWIGGLKRAISVALRSQQLWQPGFFDHILRSDERYAEKWNYVRDNPVRAGLVEAADDWPYQGEIVVIDRA